MNIFEHTKSLKKSIRLHRLSKKLAQAHFDDSLLNELYKISLNDEAVAYVMSVFNLNRQGYKKLYFDLLKAGGGQYADGHYVAASSLVYGQTLSFCLKHWSVQQGFEVDGIMGSFSYDLIVFRLICWFENGEYGEITF